uniref:Uncharacterized protein n=1 Tax=viral metagenome TaxID=1070528 RepID=A0A6C0LXD7_9ZZZZ
MSKEAEQIEDFLESDDQIRGQNYVCLSFVSPENVLKNKNVFFVHEFMKKMAEKYDLSSEDIEDKYKDFLYSNGEQLEDMFHKENDFKTSVRGLKVRGVYDSLKEAQVRAKVLQRKDKNFNVFVGQVGFWLPWDPHPHKVDNQEYFESELNNLVKKYKENQEDKEQHFRENIDYVKGQAEEKAKKQKLEQKLEQGSLVNNLEENSLEKNNLEENNLSDDVKKSLESSDPWLSAKERNSEKVAEQEL